jgi:DNA-binding ferritin-like protein (Dps family)
MATLYNYYGTLEYYNDNIAIYPKALAIWNTYTDNQKKAILTRLSKQIDISGKWCGFKSDFNQVLEFPRDYSNTWIDEYLWDDYYKYHNKIPEMLFDIIIELLNDNLVGDENRFSDLYTKGVRSISDNLISVSLDRPLEIKNIYNYVDKYMFVFTVMGLTQYRKRNGCL